MSPPTDPASNNVSVLLGDGKGSFAAATRFTVGNNPQLVAVGDVNGDLKLDLLTANANDNSVSVLLGDGKGSFAAATQFTAGSAPYSVAVGDFDGDLKPDLVIANSGTNAASVLLQTCQ